MGILLAQTRVMLRKNCLQKSAHKCTSLVQLIMPVCVCALLILLRHYIPTSSFDSSEPMPPYNTLPFDTYGFVLPDSRNAHQRAWVTDLGNKLNATNLGIPPLVLNWTIFNSESEMVDTLNKFKNVSDSYIDSVRNVGIVFHSLGDLNPDPSDNATDRSLRAAASDDVWDYSLRYGDLVARQSYLYNTFLELQNAIDLHIIDRQAPQANLEPLRGVQYAYMPYKSDLMHASPADTFYGILFILAYLYPFMKMVTDIVSEKEMRLKEGMRSMGLRSEVFWLSWTATNAVIGLTTGLAVGVGLVAGNVYSRSSPVLVMLLFLLFALSQVTLANLMTTVFSKAKIASYISLLGLITLYAGAVVVVFVKDISPGTKVLLSFMSPSAFGLGLHTLSAFESKLSGVTFSTSSAMIDNYSFTTCLLFLALDTVLYAVLTWYLDKVLPSEFGTRAHPLFFLRASFWKRGTASPRTSQIQAGDVMDVPLLPSEAARVLSPIPVDPYWEAADQSYSSTTPGIQIRNLRKVFPSMRGQGEVVAVDDVSLDMYKGQVFCLLGHNGAGKSTTINVLTGMYESSAGECMVNGLSIISDLDKARQSLGVCPQHSILWPDLTVRHHLEIFAVLKGMAAERIPEKVVTMAGEVGLADKIDTPSKALSGGMQRKLSVGMALIGDPPVVILDEPTSGMDPSARRATQELIRRVKRDRVILLTTHYMDEADALADRIAIMSHGRVVTCGSSLFLKSLYGVGYCLVISKTGAAAAATAEDQEQEQSGNDQISASISSSSCGSRSLLDFVQDRCPDSTLLTEAGNEISFSVPFKGAKDFPKLLSELDDLETKSSLRVSHYGVSVTTLEEVFLKVAEGQVTEQEKRRSLSQEVRGVVPRESVDVNNSANSNGDNGNGSNNHSNSNFDPKRASFLPHVAALYQKRFRYAKRDKNAVCCQCITPLVVLAIGFALTSILNPAPSVLLSVPGPDVISPTTVVFASANATSSYFCDGSVLAAMASPSVKLQDVPVTSLDAFDDWLIANPAGASGENRDGGVFFDKTLPVILYNNENGNSVSAFLNFLHNACLKSLKASLASSSSFDSGPAEPSSPASDERAGDSHGAAADATCSIKTRNYPFPPSDDATFTTTEIQSLIVTLFVNVAFSFIPFSFIQFIVKEREIKAKHQQLVSGVSGASYWVASFLWDMTTYLVPCTGAVVLIFVMDNDNLKEGDNMSAILVVFLLFGPSVIAFTHCASHLFKRAGAAQNAMIIWYLFSGLGLGIVEMILNLISASAVRVFAKACRIFPNYSLSHALSSIMQGGLGGAESDPFAMSAAGLDMLMMVVSFVVFSAITLLIEVVQASPTLLGQFCKNKDVPDQWVVQEDEDVMNEKRRLQAGATDAIRVEGVRKVYNGKSIQATVAVRDLWFGVPSGECFGFLGVNGAGKTTTLSCLTADIPLTRGNGHLAEFSVLSQQQELRRNLGYCPQFDPLFDYLTGREHLQLYAKVKGVRSSTVMHKEVARMLDDLSLTRYADKMAGGYSGGNKRKLSVACALIGNPSLVFLDEPSTGMDPVARRFMWQYISHTMRGRAVILTTHSMAEAEALCQKIGIMVAGSLACLGTAQHLKNKFGQGHQLDLLIVTGQENNVKAFVWSHFPAATLLDDYAGHAKFHLRQTGMTLSQLFSLMEENKSALSIIEYALSQTTLEQVFLGFANRPVVTTEPPMVQAPIGQFSMTSP